MFYVILVINLAILGLVVALAVRLFRASPEKRSAMLRPKKKTILFAAGTFAVFFIVVGAVIFSAFGTAGISVTSAAKDYLREQYGPVDTWTIDLSDHVERSQKPESGLYQIHYRYGDKEGDLVVEYFERDGKLAFKITPRQK